MAVIFIPYSYGDKVTVEDEIGPLGYLKCKKCKKMSLHIMKEGTLQNHIDGFIPAGRKRKSYIIECSKCGGYSTPKVGREDDLIALIEQYPTGIDFERIETVVSEFYTNDNHVYVSSDAAIEQFPKNCVNAIAKDKPAKYQKAVFDSAVAFIYNKEWDKSTMGKTERKVNILAMFIMIGIIALVIGAIAGIVALINFLVKK